MIALLLMIGLGIAVTWFVHNRSTPTDQPRSNIPAPQTVPNGTTGVNVVLLPDPVGNVTWIKNSPLILRFGSDPGQIFRNRSEVLARLQAIKPGFEARNLEDSEGAYVARLSDGRELLVMGGCIPHMCGSYHAAAAFDSSSGEAFLFERVSGADAARDSRAFYGRDDSSIRALLTYFEMSHGWVYDIVNGNVPARPMERGSPDLTSKVLGRWRQTGSGESASEPEFLADGTFSQHRKIGSFSGRWSFIDDTRLKVDGYACPCPIRFDAETLILSFEGGTETFERTSSGESSPPAPPQADVKPSFNCANAKRPTEKLICGDSELASAELGMVAAYNQVLNKLSSGERNTFLKGHLEWFKDWAKTCDAVAANGTEGDPKECVKRYLSTRTAQLKQMVLSIDARPTAGTAR
jgi:uncharacterized protein YecT (DUF1311 family)